MYKRPPETADCDMCVGNRQLLNQLLADVAALSEKVTEGRAPATRQRHYVMTLQSGDGGEPYIYGTVSGPLCGYTDEDAAFETIRRAACEKLTGLSDREWTPENSAVLFYRLVEDA
jgi:hypothetical protein